MTPSAISKMCLPRGGEVHRFVFRGEYARLPATIAGVKTVTVTLRRGSRPIAAALLMVCLTLPAAAEVFKYKAVLKPLSADGGAGSGRGQFTYDSSTNQLEYIVVFE